MEEINVFGGGNYCKHHIYEIKDNYIVDSIYDNNNYNVSLDNFLIKKTNCIAINQKKILIMVVDFFEIILQLIAGGIGEEKIIIGDNLIWEDDGEEIRKIKENSHISVLGGKVAFINKISDKSVLIDNVKQLDILRKEVLRDYYLKYSEVYKIKNLPLKPISRDFGMHRGKAIDRYFIEAFLADNKDLIKGNVLEIGDDYYTKKYGKENEYKSFVMHVWEGKTDRIFKGNFETGEGLENKSFDAMIITQTLMFIFDVKKACQTIYNSLNKGGYALITVSGLSQISRYDADRWGSYWNIHRDALQKIFVPLFGPENVEINTYGNPKLVTAMLYGVCVEEIENKAFEYIDEDYPLVYTVKLHKVRN